MAILKKLSILLAPVLLSGCYQDFIPKVDSKPVLCLNSLITAGEPIEVSVSHTWLYTDVAATDNHEVTDAIVTIYVNGSPAPEGYLPAEGDRIKITADSKSYGYAEAEVTVPEGNPETSLTWEAEVKDVIVWNHIDELITDCRVGLRARLKVSDNSEVDNYYLLTYTGRPETYRPSDDVSFHFGIGPLNYDAEPIFSEHIGIIDELAGSDPYGVTFFTDRQFNGGSYSLNLQFNDISYSVIFPIDYELSDEITDCDVILYLNNVSQGYYKWCNYLWNTDNGMVGDLAEAGLSDPIWGYSNVSSGAGIVAAQTRSIFTIPLKDIISEAILSSKIEL